MVTINESTLRHDIFETFYDIANAITYSTSTAPTITAAYIDGAHAPFPQIVINPIDISVEKILIGERTSDNMKLRNVVVTIDIYTKKNEDLDLIVDLLDTSIIDTQITGVTMVSNDENTNTVFPNDQKLRSKTLTYAYMR